MSTPQDEVMVTTAQAARFLGVSEGSVIRWANRGDIPHVRTGAGHRRFRLGDLDPVLASRRTPNVDPGTKTAAGGSQ